MPRANGIIVEYEIESGEVVIEADRDGKRYKTSLAKTHDFFEPTKINPAMKEIGRPQVGGRVAFIINPTKQQEIGWWGRADSTISG